jgi:lysine 2,3-aminomutase
MSGPDPQPETELVRGVDPATRIPYAVSRFYAGLARGRDPEADPIAAQFMPRAGEHTALPYESADPIGDKRYLATERLIHHYPDRALLLVTDQCASYCRFCFRRHFTGKGAGSISRDQLEDACDYLARHPGITEVLLSGGDPLTLPHEALTGIIERLRKVGTRYLIRLCTRVPVVMPSRVTPELARALGGLEPLWVVTHANHPAELTDQFRDCARLLRAEGIPVLSQSVLLRGVNDEARTLEALFKGLVSMGVKPYYLFQGDLAVGTAHFRVDLGRGMAIMRELRARMSGLALPAYAVDLPDGAGKVAIEAAFVRAEPDAYVLRGSDGAEHRYPREP